MTNPTPPAQPRPVPANPEPCLSGPYDPEKGSDAYGHPVNECGRCEGMNATPPTCPPGP